MGQPREALVFGIEFTADERDRRQHVHPHQQRDRRADAAVEDVVAGDVADVPPEPQRGREPEQRGHHGAGPHETPALRAAWSEEVQHHGDAHAGGHSDGVAGSLRGQHDPRLDFLTGLDHAQPAQYDLLGSRAEQNQAQRQCDRERGRKHEQNGHSLMLQERPPGGNFVDCLETLHQAGHHARRRPNGDQRCGHQ